MTEAHMARSVEGNRPGWQVLYNVVDGFRRSRWKRAESCAASMQLLCLALRLCALRLCLANWSAGAGYVGSRGKRRGGGGRRRGPGGGGGGGGILPASKGGEVGKKKRPQHH